MADLLRATFRKCKKQGKTAFVAFVTASYPTDDDTVPLLLALQEGGVDVIELGIPFSDPMADGTTIQKSSEVALAAGASLTKSLDLLGQARKKGLKVPVVLMGYLNPFLAMGFEVMCKRAAECGVSGFIIVDLPCDEAGEFISTCHTHGLAYVPLLSPTSTDERMKVVGSLNAPFIYCVSVAGVTGQRTSLASDLPEFIGRIRKFTQTPLAVGFGISKSEHVIEVGKHADGAVVGSAVIAAIESGNTVAERATNVTKLIQGMTGRSGAVEVATPSAADSPKAKRQRTAATKEDKPGMYGGFGGRFIPETLVAAHEELEAQFNEAMKDKEFLAQMQYLRTEYCGGPTPMYHAKRLSEATGGAQIWFKQEHLAHTGAHKINNALGQVLLAKRLGKPRVIAETGAGQHGVATATACALLGIKCVVYMGQVDVERQSLNVFRMRVLGAEVHPVSSGSKTLKDAINEAMRDWVTNVRDTHYCVGSAIGPHPFPLIVREFQAVIGKEARAQIQEKAGRLPDVAIACVGGGSNAIGLFHPFVGDKSVKLIGVEAGGVAGPPGPHSATLAAGVPGVLHGTRTYLIQDKEGQIEETHSISAGLDYPGVGPEHAYLKDIGRAEYVSVTDSQALEALQQVSKCEGIIPALEPSHALYHAIQRAKSMKKDEIVLVNLCGRGDKDMHTVAKALGVKIDWTNM